MLIGILQCGHFPTAEGHAPRSYLDLYSTLLAGQGFSFQVWSVVDMEFPESVHEAQGWLISGSRHGAYEDLPFIAELEDFICRAYAKSIPLVGVCFGHQILAQALGGRVEKHANGWGVGRQDYDFDGKTLHLNAWHQDQVVEAPARAQTVASNDFCQHAALLYEGKAYSVQPHPEFDSDAVRLLLDERAPGVVPDDLITAATSQVDERLNNSIVAEQIANFFKTGSPNV